MLDFIKAFDLAKPPLMRAGLIEIEPARHVLVVDMHHIISDGVSVNILMKDLSRIYEGTNRTRSLFNIKTLQFGSNRTFRNGTSRARKRIGWISFTVIFLYWICLRIMRDLPYAITKANHLNFLYQNT